MKTSLIIAAALFLLTMLSCSSEQNNSKNTRTEQKQTLVQPENTQNTSATSSENATIDNQSQENTVNESIVIPPPLNTGFNAQNSADAPVLNPPHGQPGHICEIPVGSPLPRAANNVQKANTAATNNPVNTTTTSIVDQTVVLNPPHGQPGHICEIPVGSPLPKGSTIPKTGNN
jgi:flagellum-specific peptidoglycan hydrolase FlgJ